MNISPIRPAHHASGAWFALLLPTALLAAAEFREEFQQSFPLSPEGRLMLENINGSIAISTWEKDEVKVDALKTARQEAQLSEVKIEITSKPDNLSILTRYPSPPSGGSYGRRNQSARVDYTLTVPRRARLDKVSTVNGTIEIEAVEGPIEASTVNGAVTVRKAGGNARLNSVNGPVRLTHANLNQARSIFLESVNGSLELALPAELNADISASTVNGRISTDVNLPVKKNFPIGQELRGQVGRGGTCIRANVVNGNIHLRRSDGAPSPP